MYKDEGRFDKAMDLGVKGYGLKDSAIGDTRGEREDRRRRAE